MTVFATEGIYSRFSSLVKISDTPEKFEFHNDVLTVNDAASTLTLGTALGKVTATGKYKVSVATANDGSQVPIALVLGNSFGEIRDITLAANTDTKVVALTRGKVIVALEAIKLDASFASAAQKQFAYDSLKSVNILPEVSM